MRCRSATYITARKCLVQSCSRQTQACPLTARHTQSIPGYNPTHPTQALQAELHDCQLSLAALPATALACIFQHLNGVNGFSLAQTCHACASEFAHQKADFTQKVCKELAPTVTCDPPSGDHECYGTASNPVSLHLKWGKNPGAALRRLYAISQQPDGLDVVNELWRQAWPQALGQIYCVTVCRRLASCSV